MSTVIKAIDALLKDDTLTGQTIELSLDKIYFRKPVDYVDESSRWIGLESANYWALGARKS
jgi:15-hydroxyprostaglandin dehydrogenase (NAD)